MNRHPSEDPDSCAQIAGWNEFAARHIGPRPEQMRRMLAALGLRSLDELAEQVIPQSLRRAEPLRLPPPLTEHEALERLRAVASKNRRLRSLIGMGFHGCVTPAVIRRYVLENPDWYTPYTPYQSEISQGRLECLFYFQTMIAELTGMEIANASLLDEATAAAEAMALCYRRVGGGERNRFLIAADCHPQTIEVVQTRAEAFGWETAIVPPEEAAPEKRDFGILFQYPATNGAARDLRPLIERAHAAGALAVAAADLLGLALLVPPGDMGADVVVGTTQRFGQPMAYGGPHAAYLATRDAFKRQMPGRLVGLSRDALGRPAYRLALGAREQHIRREKATSNICTAQALPAVVAALYAIYHGPEGLRAIAERIHRLAVRLAETLRRLEWEVGPEAFFDTICVAAPDRETADQVVERALEAGFNLRRLDERTVAAALDELSDQAEVDRLAAIFAAVAGKKPPAIEEEPPSPIPAALRRDRPFLRQRVFHEHRSETAMARFLRRLASKDYSLATGMIPLGSCTMKLNPAAAMLPIVWEEFADLHPFAPREQAAGYAELLSDLEERLKAITGMDAVCFQPTAGAHGEYAGLLAIRRRHIARGEPQRRVCLIPASAHGTNPASAVMAGLEPVTVTCAEDGSVDLADLKAKAAERADELAALMLTYPSTHGVFEAEVREMIETVHRHGGLVYLDGANLNAMVGWVSPGELGADVCHLNLHKTFAMPHGGGGPGAGPIAVRSWLKPFLPGHRFLGDAGPESPGPVAAAPFGNAGILPIAWVYIACMGAEGLRLASLVALLNANYVVRRLERAFPTVYRSREGWVAHEGILELRGFKRVTAEDVAKRLMDYGFHAPTLSWPVAGTLMVEPTESEPLEELDRFCEAMEGIYGEIAEIETGAADPKNNLLKNAPHTAEMAAADEWTRPYSRSCAVYPVEGLRQFKFWPAVARVDNVYGDRHPVCVCPPE